MTLEEFARLRVSTALKTYTGYCIHDWRMTPSPLHGHCIDCEDHVYEKTAESVSRIRSLYQVTKSLLDQAECAAREHNAGAKKWEDKHRATLARIGQLLAILEDPAVPDGTFFQLPPGK